LKQEAAVGKRRMAREMAVQMLYQRDLGASQVPEVLRSFDVPDFLRERVPQDESEAIAEASTGDQREARDAFEYARRLVEGTLDHLEEIDGLLRAQADNWRLERMPAVDRNVLRLAVYEFMHELDVPKLVVIDEAVELAKRFGSEQSGRFVNGLLDGLLRSHAFPGSLQ
jgi:N utilization substance protein B